MSELSNIAVLVASDETENSWLKHFCQNLAVTIAGIASDARQIDIVGTNDDALADILEAAGQVLIFVSDNAVLKGIKPFLESASNANMCLILNKLPDWKKIDLYFRNMQNYTFFDVDPETNLARIYMQGENEKSEKLYWSKLLDLAFFLSGKSGATHAVDKTIFVAETNTDQYENRDAIRSELIHRGFKVIPNHSLAGNYNELSSIITSYLEQCSMSVHIVGNSYGEIISDSEWSITELQCRLAAKRWRISSDKDGETQFQRMVWLPPGLKPGDERHRRFIGSLRVEDKDAYSEIIQTPLEDLKSALVSKLTVTESYTETNKLNEKLVYLIMENKDSGSFESISDFLQNKGIKVLSIDYSNKRQNMVSRHYEYLTQAEAVLIFEANSSKQWINSKLKDLVKAPGYGRLADFEAKAILTKHVSRYGKFTQDETTIILDANMDIKESLIPFLMKLNLQ